MHESMPRVAVLLASYNGERWIEMQVRSILDCTGVETHVFLSDDGSTDETVKIAKKVGADRITVLPAKPQGSAGQNFIRLVLDTPWSGFDYVSLADQDDLWTPGKLERAVVVIESNSLAAYSSDVTAFWPDGRRRYIRKSQPLRRWDHLFESGGPGNTFVWPLSEAEFLRSHLLAADPEVLHRIELHDWAFFAIFREAGRRWKIDRHSGLDYRQHGANVLGAAKGFKAVLGRIDLLRKGWYRRQVLCIADLTGADNPALEYMRSPKFSRIWVVTLHARQCRRKTSESVALALSMVLMAFSKDQK